MLIFRDPSVLVIFGFLAAALVGIHLLNRFFQIQAQQTAEAARKAEKAQEKAEREASRAARTPAKADAHLPVMENEDPGAGQPSDPNAQPAADPPTGVPAI